MLCNFSCLVLRKHLLAFHKTDHSYHFDNFYRFYGTISVYIWLLGVVIQPYTLLFSKVRMVQYVAP